MVKVREILGLYLNTPDKAMVLCVVEKMQIQALERTQPLMSEALAYVKSVTHDLIRHGTLTLFAALEPLVLGRASERRLLVHPQACQSPLPAGPAATLPYALHTYLGLLTQSGRAQTQSWRSCSGFAPKSS